MSETVAPPATSSTLAVPDPREVPRHISIIMDGNGRWAQRRLLPRVAGHKKGVDSVRSVVEGCMSRGVEYLTLFAFSSENWRRPIEEVSFLMRLFVSALEREVESLDKNGVRLRVVGELEPFEGRLRDLIATAEHSTARNTRLHLTIAANYGGRWDILQATQRMLKERPDLRLGSTRIHETDLSPYLSMAFAPEPDLFIRTGGEQRISNFLLWQLAYTELYFCNTWWPEFDRLALDEAIASFQQRERRFGRTSAQVAQGD